ncbi:MAG TPA: DUF4783 domain-containing protein [Bacteroidota bacterium]|nr:DUF4783 domain-containing protein [Bacteroidota bacterium]
MDMQRMLIPNAILLLLALCPVAAGQNLFPPVDSTEQDGPAVIIRAVERGLSEGDVRLFSAYFSRTVSLNVRGSGPGYYSANQAGQVLRHFLSPKKVTSFKFSTVNTGDHPFATGAATLTVNGKSERVQVYAGLSRDKSGWVISQINIY